MARKPSDRSHSQEDLEEINLVPIMAILVILIPILLYAFSFFEVKVQAVSAPRLGPTNSKPTENKEKPLQLTVEVKQKGFLIRQQAELVAEPKKLIYKRSFDRCADKDGNPSDRYCDTSGKCCDNQNKNCTACLSGGSGDEYDYPALYNYIAAKKDAFPDEKIINVGADPNIPWHTVIRTIDAARLRLEKNSYDKMESYSTAKHKTKGTGADKEPVPLFDQVVFVVVDES